MLVDALVLTCGHDLCLSCAGTAFRNTRSLRGIAVACGKCGERTQLCEEAAQTLASQPVLQPVPTVRLQAEAKHTANERSAGQLTPSSERSGSAYTGGAERSGSAYTAGSAQRRRHLPNVPVGTVSSAAETMQAVSPRGAPASPRGLSPSATDSPSSRSSLAHIPRCPDHPTELATYFCATCECFCICAECIVQRNGRHRDHEVLRAGQAHEKLRSRSTMLLDEAVALEDDFSMDADKLSWRKKDIERSAARGRASVRGAFERVRAQLNDREHELLEALDKYETNELEKIESAHGEHATRMDQLREIQENLRTRCRHGGSAVEALNSYAQAKQVIEELSQAARSMNPEVGRAELPEEFVGLAGAARDELDLHAQGLASLGEAVYSLTRRPDRAADSGGRHTPQGSMSANDRRGELSSTTASSGPKLHDLLRS